MQPIFSQDPDEHYIKISEAFYFRFFSYYTHLLGVLRSSFLGSLLLSFTFSSVTYFYPELQLLQLNSCFFNSLVLEAPCVYLLFQLRPL